MAKKLYYIGERINPQLRKPYFVAYGQLTKKDAKSHSNPVYGSMIMNSFANEQDYLNKIVDLKAQNFTVNLR